MPNESSTAPTGLSAVLDHFRHTLAPAKRISFPCGACGVPHDLERDLAQLRRPRPLDDPPAHVVLMRAFRYAAVHAKAVVRELEARGLLTGGAN